MAFSSFAQMACLQQCLSKKMKQFLILWIPRFWTIVVDMTIHDGVHPHRGPVQEVGVPSTSHEFVSVDAVVPAHTGVGYNGRFAVLAEEDSDDEAMLEVRACRRQVAASPSFPPTEADPVRPTEVDMESASEPRWLEAETEPILFVFPESEVGSDVEVNVESEADIAPVAMIRPSAAHPSRVRQFGHGECAGGHRNQELCDEGASSIHPRCIQIRHEVSVARESVSGMELQNRLRILRGWKLFILIPRMLLFRPARGGKVPKNQLLDRLSKFADGQWLDLLGKSQEASENAARLRSRRRWNRVDEVGR